MATHGSIELNVRSQELVSSTTFAIASSRHLLTILLQNVLQVGCGGTCLCSQLLGRWRQKDHSLRPALALGQCLKPCLKQTKAKGLGAWIKR
jgi:hypothetical protein